ncbi:MAG: alpha-amylase family glycosyl hydrolase [bacterium]
MILYFKLKLLKFEKNKVADGLRKYPRKEFHVARTARDKYGFEETVFTSSGNVIFADFQAARRFAQKMNAGRDLVKYPQQAVKAGQINAMGLIDEILHYLIVLYRQQVKAAVMAEALTWLQEKVGSKSVENTLYHFAEHFPTRDIYKANSDIQAYLDGKTDGVPNRQIVLEEMLMLWIANQNPAFTPFNELFDDASLEAATAYSHIMQSVTEFFETQPRFGPENQNLVELLRTPALREPHSLEKQLLFIRRHWGLLIEPYQDRLLISLGMMKEENKAVFTGPPPTVVAEYAGEEWEPEQFSVDLHWMPRLVLIAKSTLVWLDQLSKKYQRAINRLDQIPDEELDKLARWGFTGLWLIGVWQRSPASKTIKQLCGNPEAESSAYSLFDYEIADEIGGTQALINLRNRCWQRGIRLASDMVPNHTGIDSRWVREHPDWFISLPYPPFPAYSFTGPNLSQDPRYGIFIEDKYFDRSDAAVVFKREDYWNGDVCYIFHGNDGTSMPWNDTAQLNYLNSEVREAVIQKILHVVRLFPIIRFDAAMTLAKKHFQRLWFPEPGSGGDIPSRSEHGLTNQEFNQRMPQEFWREVVDRVAQEAPDTLLLAEAFWLMEGYFVRTLGMHRVYNSAFMNMLKNEENEKYRSTIKNTIEFNPEILKRYVNFMNNPDEDTALAQFGDGDKYFGICLMMVTMPGLPMFGHGQIEGFSEKYGMEYRRAYWDEPENQGLIQRHEREIFPVMKKRYLFAEVENYLLYDFFNAEGRVNENVFAYSNRFHDQRALVVYNNKFEHARGWIRTSAAYAAKTGNGKEIRLQQKNLGEGLGLPYDENSYCIFRDQIGGLEYLRNCKELHENGLYVELDAYKHHLFLNFRLVQDNPWRHYAQLCHELNGLGVASVDEELKEQTFKPLLASFEALLNIPDFEEVFTVPADSEKNKKRAEFLKEFEKKYLDFLRQVKKFALADGDESKLCSEVSAKLKSLLGLPHFNSQYSVPQSRKYQSAVRYLQGRFIDEPRVWSGLYLWLLLHGLGKIAGDLKFAERSRSWLDQWLLGKRAQSFIKSLIPDEAQTQADVLLINNLIVYQNWYKDLRPKKLREHRILKNLVKSSEVQRYLQINRFENVFWFNKERFEELLWWLFAVVVLQLTSQPNQSHEQTVEAILEVYGIIQKWQRAEKGSEYKVQKMLSLLKNKK